MPGQFCCGEGEDGPAVGGRAYMWCVTGDWCAYACVLFVYISLMAIDITTTFFCIIPMFGLHTWTGIAHLIFFQTTVFMVVYSHLSASWADPGLVSKDATGLYLEIYERQLARAIEAEKQGDIVAVKKLKKSFCRKCSSPKPQGSHHCSLCNRCVRKMDHHCPWVNNCVGERNLKAFFLFLCYVTIGTGYALIMYALRAYQIITSTRPEDRRSGYPRNIQIAIVVTSVLSFIVAVFFFAFVMCMFYDQYEALTTGIPGVDAMQIHGDIPKIQSCWTGLNKMIMVNEPFGWKWFIPIAPKLPQPPPPPTPLGHADEKKDTQTSAEGEADVITIPQEQNENLSSLMQRFPPPKEFTEKPHAAAAGLDSAVSSGNAREKAE